MRASEGSKKRPMRKFLPVWAVALRPVRVKVTEAVRESPTAREVTALWGWLESGAAWSEVKLLC
jgi:hypothetical protein